MPVMDDPIALLMKKRKITAFFAENGGQLVGVDGLTPDEVKKLETIADTYTKYSDQFFRAVDQMPSATQADRDAKTYVLNQAKAAVNQAAQDFSMMAATGRIGLVRPGYAPVGQSMMHAQSVNGALAAGAPAIALLNAGGAIARGVAFDPLAVNLAHAPLLMLGAGLAAASPIGVARVLDRDFISTGDVQLDALLAAGGGSCFEDRVFLMMCAIVKDMQDKIEARLEQIKQDALAAENASGKKKGKGGGILGAVVGVAAPIVGGIVGGPVGAAVGSAIGGAVQQKANGGSSDPDKHKESRNIEFEKVKYDMQKLSQMQQAMSNVLNTMDELAKSAIRHIKV